MANIDTYLTAIQNAVYGEEVRSSIVNAIAAINTEVQTGISSVVTSADNHRNIYRGRSLGTSFTNEQKNAIANGTFDNLYIGDNWTINGIQWRIVDIDYFYNMGQQQILEHHIVVSPVYNLYAANMNDTATVAGAYRDCKMRTTNLAQARTAFQNAFGSAYVLSHTEYLISRVDSSGRIDSAAWTDCLVELMSERMVYGCNILQYISPNKILNTTDPQQFALFQLRPKTLAMAHQQFWLRDVGPETRFCAYNSTAATASSPTNNLGVRPYALICGNPQNS